MICLTKEINRIICFSSFLMLISGCSGLQQSEEERLRRQNVEGEFIHRHHDEHAYPLSTPTHRIRDLYSWEKRYHGKYPKITKEYFRCRGSPDNTPRPDLRYPAAPASYFDCGGFEKHSLPIRDNQEFIYPVLVDLLNYVQSQSGHKVVITCGHRCPVHNAYADPLPANQHSKHLIGAEVDFYVQGLEHKPEEVVALVMKYYKEERPELRNFERLNTGKWNVVTPPWCNQEIVIKLYHKDEGRDVDNMHPYPYIGIQVRMDRATGAKVVCDGQQAFRNYRRY